MDYHYKTPLKKLVKFFEESRNKWKARSLKLGQDIIRYKNRIKFLESSKARLKKENKDLKSKLSSLEELVKKNSR